MSVLAWRVRRENQSVRPRRAVVGLDVERHSPLAGLGIKIGLPEIVSMRALVHEFPVQGEMVTFGLREAYEGRGQISQAAFPRDFGALMAVHIYEQRI